MNFVILKNLVIEIDQNCTPKEVHQLKAHIEECMCDYYNNEGCEVSETGFNTEDLEDVSKALQVVLDSVDSEYQYKIHNPSIHKDKQVFQLTKVLAIEKNYH